MTKQSKILERRSLRQHICSVLFTTFFQDLWDSSETEPSTTQSATLEEKQEKQGGRRGEKRGGSKIRQVNWPGIDMDRVAIHYVSPQYM